MYLACMQKYVSEHPEVPPKMDNCAIYEGDDWPKMHRIPFICVKETKLSVLPVQIAAQNFIHQNVFCTKRI